VIQFTCADGASCHGAFARCEPTFPHLLGCSSTGPGRPHAAGVPFLPATASRTGPSVGPRRRNVSATAGMGPAGCSKFARAGRDRFDDQRGLRDRRIPDGGSQSPHLDWRVPCRACGFRRLQSKRPIAPACGMVLSTAVIGARRSRRRHPVEPVTQGPRGRLVWAEGPDPTGRLTRGRRRRQSKPGGSWQGHRGFLSLAGRGSLG
jgi:hypothetical protein